MSTRPKLNIHPHQGGIAAHMRSEKGWTIRLMGLLIKCLPAPSLVCIFIWHGDDKIFSFTNFNRKGLGSKDTMNRQFIMVQVSVMRK